MPGMDFAAAGLLDGLTDKERQSRLELLERLEAEGFTPDELKAAAAENRLTLLPVQRVLGGRYTASEVARLSGASAEEVLRMRRLLGLPEATAEDTVFGEEDVRAAQALVKFLDAGFAKDSIDEIMRVLGESMARVSAATSLAFAQAFMRRGDTEREVASRFAERAESLAPGLDAVLASSYRAHLREQARISMISPDELAAGEIAGELELAVGFADLVGFTRLGGELEAGELRGVVSTFGRLAAEAAGPRVRLVKTIGDAAMFASAEPERLVACALDLLEATERAELPSLRAGIAFGSTLARAGDLYGHAVNLASRVTGVARPGSVLCTAEIRDAAPERFEWTFARRHRLKGIGDAVPLYRARRLRD
jgi:adenylate cyclase